MRKQSPKSKMVYWVIFSVSYDMWCGTILHSVCMCVCVHMCICVCVCVLTSKISFPIQHDVFGLQVTVNYSVVVDVS